MRLIPRARPLWAARGVCLCLRPRHFPLSFRIRFLSPFLSLRARVRRASGEESDPACDPERGLVAESEWLSHPVRKHDSSWRNLEPADLAGVHGTWNHCMTPDGEGYAYTCSQVFDDLFLLEALRF